MIHRSDKTRQGVEDAFQGWLADHPISMPEMVQDAIKDAFYRWLDDHADEVLAAISRAATEARP